MWWFLLVGCIAGSDITVPSMDLDSGLVVDDTEPPLPAWTLMVFMNGDNDLERAALKDLNEMEKTGSSEQVQVVVQLDRSPDGTPLDGDWSGARRFLVEQDRDANTVNSTVLETLGEVDSGSPETVHEFVAWAVDRFPARRYGLVLWDHGSGWRSGRGESVLRKGISEDFSSQNSLSIAEGDLADALAGATEAIGRPLDLFGMDACRMQTWEVAYAAAPYARIQVASQADESLEGWSYADTLTELIDDPDMDEAALGEVIARRFTETGEPTLSVVDLEALHTLNQALDELADAVMARPVDWEDAATASLFFSGVESERDLRGLATALAANEPQLAEAGAAVDAAARVAHVESLLSSFVSKAGVGIKSTFVADHLKNGLVLSLHLSFLLIVL